jgi:hypothetical protein
MQLLTFQKNILGTVHLLTKPDKWDYLLCHIIEKKSSVVLTLEKFLEALGSGSGTGTVFAIHFHFRKMCTKTVG